MPRARDRVIRKERVRLLSLQARILHFREDESNHASIRDLHDGLQRPWPSKVLIPGACAAYDPSARAQPAQSGPES